MLYNLETLENGLIRITCNFQDEGVFEVCQTTVKGDADRYAQILANDFRNNNKELFFKEDEIIKNDMMGEF